jgi:hypothetical protein
LEIKARAFRVIWIEPDNARISLSIMRVERRRNSKLQLDKEALDVIVMYMQLASKCEEGPC